MKPIDLTRMMEEATPDKRHQALAGCDRVIKSMPESLRLRRKASLIPEEEIEDGNHCPGWVYVNCGCCAGLKWGGDSPRECTDCDGMGFLWKHIKSGVLAQYPGGPFLGSEPKGDIKDEQ